MVGVMNAAQEWVLRPRKVAMMRCHTWAAANLCQGDTAILETTGTVWAISDSVGPLVTGTVVAHAGAVRQIADVRGKPHTEDLQRLFRLLIAAIVPDVWVQPAHVRTVRGLRSSRNRLGTPATMIRNRLHRLLHRHNLKVGENGLTDAAWWESQPLGAPENLHRRQALALPSASNGLRFSRPTEPSGGGSAGASG